MSQTKSLFMDELLTNSRDEELKVHTVNLTSDSFSLLSSALTELYRTGNRETRSMIENFLDSTDGRGFYLVG